MRNEIYELEKAKNENLTLKYEDRYIHSKYDPVNEGMRFAKANIDNFNDKTILVYGLGLGYHIKAMADMVNNDILIYVFEYNMNLINYCKKVNPDIFKYNNIKIIGSDEKNFYEKFSDLLNISNKLIIHKASLDTIHNTNEHLYNLINDFSRIRQQTLMELDIILESDKNIEANNECNAYKIEKFIEQYKNNNKDFVITSAGPSIDEDILVLKANREKFNIIAVGSALRTLIDNEIYPDCVVIIDPREIVKKQFENIDCTNLKLCFYASASRQAVSKFEGEKYIFNNPKDKTDCIEITISGTVAVASMDLALKCGAKRIIMLGQDLSYIGDKSHTSTFEKTYGFKDQVNNIGKNKLVKGYNGKPVETIQGYITFKNKIESLIHINSDVQFINCSKGAYIEGAVHIDLRQICK